MVSKSILDSSCSIHSKTINYMNKVVSTLVTSRKYKLGGIHCKSYLYFASLRATCRHTQEIAKTSLDSSGQNAHSNDSLFSHHGCVLRLKSTCIQVKITRHF